MMRGVELDAWFQALSVVDGGFWLVSYSAMKTNVPNVAADLLLRRTLTFISVNRAQMIESSSQQGPSL